MDVIKMLAELRQEREQLEEAILTLERLARGRGRRRGRPPAWMTELKRRGRPPGSKNKTKESAAAWLRGELGGYNCMQCPPQAPRHARTPLCVHPVLNV